MAMSVSCCWTNRSSFKRVEQQKDACSPSQNNKSVRLMKFSCQTVLGSTPTKDTACCEPFGTGESFLCGHWHDLRQSVRFQVNETAANFHCCVSTCTRNQRNIQIRTNYYLLAIENWSSYWKIIWTKTSQM